jgi:hypothetical protein
MPGLAGLPIPFIDTAAGTVVVPLWAAGGLTAIALALVVLAFCRAGAIPLAFSLLGIAALLLGALTAVVFDQHARQANLREQRAALDQRALLLSRHALTPGSPLACLDADMPEQVLGACEKALFSSAETIGAAISHVAARLGWLADAQPLAERDRSYEAVMAEHRRALEADAFGLVAQVLAARDGCSSEACPRLSVLRDRSRVLANLREKHFDDLLGRHAAQWPARTVRPALAGTPAPATAVFPSAASIPPVSIMNNEPSLPAAAGAAAPTSAAVTPAPGRAAAPSRRMPRPPRASAPPPLALSPPPPGAPPPGTSAEAPARQP